MAYQIDIADLIAQRDELIAVHAKLIELRKFSPNSSYLEDAVFFVEAELDEATAACLDEWGNERSPAAEAREGILEDFGQWVSA